MNLYQHAKNQAILSINSGDVADIKIAASRLASAFWSISHEPDFSQIWHLYRNTGIRTKCHYRTNP